MTVLFFCFLFLPSIVFAANAPFRNGETITYDIKKGVKVGQAVLTFVGPVQQEGNTRLLVTFKASGWNFYDNEEIYLSPDTYLPMVVIRDINIFGSKEKIREDYLQTANKIYVHKTVRGKTTTQVLTPKATVENIYGFIYRFRQSGSFRVGEEVAIHLPTQDLKIGIVNTMRLDVGKRKAASFYMESKPDKFKIWFSVDQNRIPLKISGSMGIANTVMVMSDYKQ